MAKGRGTAVVGAVMVCLLVLQYSHMITRAAVYTMGDDHGWTVNVASRSTPKHFRAGDTLVFNYSPAAHNVVAVNRKAYNHCMTTRGSKFHRTGKDKIKPTKGQNYFICSLPRQCKRGMKIAITAV